MTGAAVAATGPATFGEDTPLATLQQLRRPVVGELARFAVVGGLSTLLNAMIFLFASSWWNALPANLAALILSTVVSTEVNRRFTFGGAPVRHWRAHVQSGGTVLFYAFYSSAVLLVLDVLVPTASAVLQSVTMALASLLGGTGRFLVMRYWVFAIRR